MKDCNDKVGLLKQREIEIRVLGPVIEAFAKELGKERAYEIVRAALQGISAKQGAEKSAEVGKGLSSFKENCVSAWSPNGELEIEMKESGEDVLRFDVKRCAYAELYKALGLSEIGALVSCDRDRPFIEGFDGELTLERDKTIMAGDDVCNFCYKKKA